MLFFFADLDFSASSVALRCFGLFCKRNRTCRSRRSVCGEGGRARPIIVSLISPIKSLCMSALGGEGVNLPGLAFAAGNAGKVFNCSCTTYTICPPPFFAVLAISCGRMRRGVPFDFRRLSKKPKNESSPPPFSPSLYLSKLSFFPSDIALTCERKRGGRRKEEECVKNRILLLSWPRISDFSFSLSPSFAQGRRTYLFGEGGGRERGRGRREERWI